MLRTDSGSSRGTSGIDRASDPAAVLLDDAARVAQVAHEVGHEQRAALRLRVNRAPAKSAGRRCSGNSSAR